MLITRGDIFWVDFPAPVGRHAGIVVSNDYINNNSSTVEAVVLTTNIRERTYPTDADIMSSGRHTRAQCGQVYTISRNALVAHIGHCTSTEMEAVNAALLDGLGIRLPTAESAAPVTGHKDKQPSLHRTPEGLIVEVADDGVYVYGPMQSFEFEKGGD